VWEWCADWYDKDYYKQSPSQNPKGPSYSRWYRVIRGGSFRDGPSTVRCSTRGALTHDDRVKDVGFRIVRVK
jgi:sulfatase modifying factor 1